MSNSLINYIYSNIIVVPGGALSMGSNIEEVGYCVEEWKDCLVDSSYKSKFQAWIMKEYPEHIVNLPSFISWMYPVTNLQYSLYAEEMGLPFPESLEKNLPDDHPVWGVKLEEASSFAKWISYLDGNDWRLPTEAEWEWMASGPENLRYPFGNAFDKNCCNTIESKIKSSTPVNAYQNGVSWCGVYDLAGNIEEWTSSIYTPYPGGQLIEDDLIKLLGKNYSILRGGSFELGGDLTRSSRRHGPHPGFMFRVTGFRLVCSKKGAYSFD